MTGTFAKSIRHRCPRAPGCLVVAVLLAPSLAVFSTPFLMGGCASEPSFVLDSDLPAPDDASGRATSGIERRGSELVGVRTVFADEVRDPEATLETLRRRFVAGGWTVESSGATGSTSTAIFRKGDRRCRVRIVRNDLDPGMSRIAYLLDTVPPDPASSDADG